MPLEQNSKRPGGDGSAKPKVDYVEYRYVFKFGNGDRKEFVIHLDPGSLEYIRESEAKPPEWARLGFSQCEGCPLGTTKEYCPVAVNLVDVVTTFQDRESFEPAEVVIETAQRTYTKNVALQKGISSLLGILMSTSNCPIMDNLRPMTRFHLPFATTVETFYRMISMYITAQFIRSRKGLTPDWELKKLLDIYKKVASVNKGISQRLVNASSKDANVNAVVILHSFGDGISFFVESGLEDIEGMFRQYLSDDQNEAK